MKAQAVVSYHTFAGNANSAARSVREKIEKYMKTQQLRQHSDEFDIEFDREQLANYLGVNKSVLSHELKEMEREGRRCARGISQKVGR